MESVDMDRETCFVDVASNRVLLRLRRRLHSTGYPALRLVECEYNDGVVVLRGEVPSYYNKQVAQSVLLAESPVTAVVNLIEVTARGVRVAHVR